MIELLNNRMMERHTVRAKDIENDWCVGYLIPIVTPLNQQLYHIGNRYGTFEINTETICRNTGFFEYLRRDGDSSRFGEQIYENDIIELTFRSGNKEQYLIWYCREMNSTIFIHNEEVYFNGTDYYAMKPHIGWDQFAFIMQDPYGELSEVKVIGNIIDNPQLINQGSY